MLARRAPRVLLVLLPVAALACGSSSAVTTSAEDEIKADANFTTELPVPVTMKASAERRGSSGVSTYDLHAVAAGTHYFDRTRFGKMYAYADGSSVGMTRVDIKDSHGNVAVPAAANGSSLGPTLRTRRGEKIDVTIHGDLPDALTSLHWHGLAIPAEADTFPLAKGVGKPGIMSNMDPAAVDMMSHEEMRAMHAGTQESNAKFAIDQEAGTFWYHPHVHMDVARALYRGLAGMVIIDDDNSDALAKSGLPSDYGTDDIPIILQDYRFSKKGAGLSSGEVTYQEINGDDQKDGDGFLGDSIAVNGVLRPVLTAKRTLTRLRILNASTSRAYQLGFNTHMKFKLIATDGGFLNQPIVTDVVSLAPAERVEIVVDLNDLERRKDGSLAHGVQLVSYAFDPLDPKSALGHAASGGEWTGGGDDSGAWQKGPKPHRSRKAVKDARPDVEMGRPPAGYGFSILQIATDGGTADSRSLGKVVPAALRPKLASIAPASTLQPTSTIERMLRLEGPGLDEKDTNPKEIDFAASINNRRFDMEKLLAGDIESQVRMQGKLGDHEIWHIRNEAPDMMHPFHIHGRQFRVLRRSSGSLSATDLGYKDTIQVFPGETVDLMLDYSVTSTYDGRPSENVFYYHCHILEHEDMGMMGMFRIGSVAKPSKDVTDYAFNTACNHESEKCEDE